MPQLSTSVIRGFYATNNKKAISLILSCLMVISLFAGLGVSSFAVTQGVLTYEISDGEATITDCDESATGELIIPDTLDGCPVTCIGDFAFFKCISLTSITIPGSVTRIDNSTFWSCTGLKSVIISDGVEAIGQAAFRKCTGLTSISIPDSVTIIETEAFDSCSSLTSIDIPDYAAINGSAFKNTGYYNDESNWNDGVLYIDTCCYNSKEGVISGTYTIVEEKIKIAWKLSTSSTYPEENVETVEVETPPGKEGSVLKTFGGSLSAEKSYTILVTVSDSKGSSQKVTTLSSMILNIDFLPPAADGDVGGAAIGKAAEEDGVFDVGYESKFSGGIKNIVADKVTDLNDLKTPNTYVSINNSASTYAHLPTGLSGTFTIEVLSAGAEGQIMQRITSCTKNNHLVYVRHYYQEAWGEWVRDFNVLLYYNTSGSNGTITLNESVENFSYIEIFYCDNKGKSGGCFKLFDPHGKTICLSEIGASTSTVTYIRRTTYTISGNTITPDLTTAGYVEISGTSISHSGAGSNYLKISAVIGRERSRA